MHPRKQASAERRPQRGGEPDGLPAIHERSSAFDAPPGTFPAVPAGGPLRFAAASPSIRFTHSDNNRRTPGTMR